MKKMIQKSFFYSALVSALFCLSITEAFAKLDRIIAYVNDEVIMQSELDRRMDAMKMFGKQSRKEAIDSLIDDSIKLQLAKKVKFSIDDKTLDKSIQGIAEGNHVSVEQLYGYIEQQGFSKQSYREMIRKQMTIARIMQQQFGERVRISKSDIEKYQAKIAAKQKKEISDQAVEYQVVNVLVPISESASTAEIQAAKLQAQHIYDDLKAAKPMEQIAHQYPTAEQHNLEWRKSSELPELFLVHVQSMKVNDITAPFQAPNGFQILVLKGKREDESAKQAQAISFQQAQQALYQEKLAEVAKPWMEKARQQSFIKIL